MREKTKGEIQGRIVKVIIGLAVLGILLSAYALYEYFDVKKGNEQFCDISHKVNCSAVNESYYAEIFGIPMGLLGIFWFAGSLILAILGLNRVNLLDYLFFWALLGFGFIIWLVYVELGIIKSICLICTAVHLTVLSILILSFFSVKKTLRLSLKKKFSA